MVIERQIEIHRKREKEKEKNQVNIKPMMEKRNSKLEKGTEKESE
jgi:hypothetical protein